MEIDIRQIPEGERLSRVLDAVEALGQKEVLTLLSEDEAGAVVSELTTIYGAAVDVQRIRWGVKDLPFVIHVKRSRKKA